MADCFHGRKAGPRAGETPPSGVPAMASILPALAGEYPQLYLNPDADPPEAYRRTVLRGEEPEIKGLGHYTGDVHDRMETADTPAGPVRVVTLGNRRDFELVLRGLMAAKNGPLAPIPETQGAAMLTVFNWPRIRAHLAQFPETERRAEFQRFTSVRENYLDMLVILSRGPYSDVPAEALGFPEDQWLSRSDTIRRYHELTHVICRRLYPEDIEPIRDELIADAVGLYAAFGQFAPELEMRFLGFRDGQYVGGRLGNYTTEPEAQAGPVGAALDRIKAVIDARPETEPFALIPLLMGREAL